MKDVKLKTHFKSYILISWFLFSFCPPGVYCDIFMTASKCRDLCRVPFSGWYFLITRLTLFLGDNILAVLKYLAMSDKLADSSEYRHGNMVFFDLLGVVVVAYPARVGTILNYMVAAATFIYLAKKASLPGNGGGSLLHCWICCFLRCLTKCLNAYPYSSGGRYVRDLACATGVAILSWLITLLSVLIIALLITLLGRSMFWYTHFYASVCLYGTAATGKMVLIHTLAKNLYYGVSVGGKVVHKYRKHRRVVG